MSDDEFERGAAATVRQMARLPANERFAAAARGSANPAALAWLAEGLQLDERCAVLDIGAGMGGPAGWLTARYGCRVVCAEPALAAASATSTLFDLPVLRAAATALPVRTGSFAAALLLGVVSVVHDRVAVLREARRAARRLGLLEWCAEGDADLLAGGSRFPTPGGLLSSMAAAGWTVVQRAPVQLDAPHSWDAAAGSIEAPVERSERAVLDAIGRGALAPLMVVARR